MRVLFWSAEFWPGLGGLERISAELVRSLGQAGIRLCVVAPTYPGRPDRDEFDGIPVHRFPFYKPESYFDVEALVQLRHQILELKREWRPDLVHISGCHQSVLLHELTRQAEIPTLVTLHGALPDSDPGVSSMHERCLSGADWVCCCSQWTLNELRRTIPECHTRSSTILNALPLAEATHAACQDQPPYLLCAGRLSVPKGFDTAIRALPLCDPDLSLRLAGQGPQLEPLQQLAGELGVGHRVKFLGRLTPDQLYQAMQHSLAVLIPSRCEGFGLVALEAAWVGAPVIASRVGGLPEIVRHGETGWLVTADHPAEIAAAVRHRMDHPEAAEEMARRARHWARQSFRWSDFVGAYLDQYQRLMSARAGTEGVEKKSPNP